MHHRSRPLALTALAAAATAFGALAGPASAQIDPNGRMLRYPDVGKEKIAFVYANDLWVVGRDGGVAQPVASPPGAEGFPKLSDDDSQIAFIGNYDGNPEIYTIPLNGGLPIRVTHHPSGESLCGWTPDGQLLYYAANVVGLHRMPKLFTVAPTGGLPKQLPVPYGAAGAISGDGTWLAYTPHTRDQRTWKRYRGGMATDIWLFNLKTMESRQATTWEGTDTLPMWHDGTMYYLSDAGKNSKLNIWSYNPADNTREQITTFDDYDVKWPSIGPGSRDRGEIVFQHASALKSLELRRNRVREIEVTIPGARPTLRERTVNAANFLQNSGISSTGKRAVVEARGDIWTAPAENGSPRNLTHSAGSAERDPAWSPDGRWIAYFSDATGEYELYVTQSDGKGDTKQLTSGSKTFYANPTWSPDSKHILYTDKAANLHLVTVESGAHKVIDTDPWAQASPVSWSHDSSWVAYARTFEDKPMTAVWLYDVENDARHQVTSGMFSDGNPTFDRKGDWLYFSSGRVFTPTYSDLDTTFIYEDSEVLLAVPLRADVDHPWTSKIDEEEWKSDEKKGDDEADEDEADDDDDGDDEGMADDDDSDDDHADDDDDEDDDNAANNTGHPLHGNWTGTVYGLAALGLPEDTLDFTMSITVAKDGTITGSSASMGESADFDEIEFDEDTKTFTAVSTEAGLTTTMTGTLDGAMLEGTWEIPELGASGTWDAERENTTTSFVGPVAAPFGAVFRAPSVSIEPTTPALAVAHPLEGNWEGTLSGLAAMGLPEDSIAFTMIFTVDDDGTINGSSAAMGQSAAFDSVTFDADTGAFEAKSTEGGMSTSITGTLTGKTLKGKWEIIEFGAGGTWEATKIEDDEAESDDEATDDDESDETKADDGKKKDAKKEDKRLEIDLEGFEARALQLPVARGNFRQLAVNSSNQLLYSRQGEGIKLYDIKDKQGSEKNVAAGAAGFDISADGKKLLVLRGSSGSIQNASAGGSGKPVRTTGMFVRIDPREEWRQIFVDAWRLQRDFFYVENLHGVDWEAVREQYEAMLDDCVTREDVSYVIREMISELNVGHAYYFGGDGETPNFVPVGMLGVDWEMHDGAYRIKAIHEGAPWDTDARNPLRQQGTGIEVGHYLHAVNGMPVDPSKDPWAAFIGTANQETILTISESPEWDDTTKDVNVKPVANDAELRFRGWIEHNRKMVEDATNGQVGYIYVKNTGVDGQNDLVRQYYGQMGKKALIIDERWNGGGQIPTRFIEMLNRPVTNYWARRDGKDWAWPPDAHRGPKCMLINGLAGSGGDMFPWLFKQAGLGQLIGTRTWGGLVGISGNPPLIDGGYTAVPTFGFYETDGTWGIEGHGVDPDIKVIDDPAKMVDGGDPQLERAIALMLDEIVANPYTRPQRPRDPDRSGMGIREDDK